MATQLGMLLVVALVASNLIAMLVLQRAGTLVHPLAREQALERLTLGYRIATRWPPEQARVLLASMPGARLRLWQAAQPELEPQPMRHEEHRFARELRQWLGLPADAVVRMQLERGGGGPAREQVLHPDGWAPLRLRSSVRLPDGSWLNAVQYPAGGYEWARLLAYSLPVGTLPVLAIAGLFVRRLVRPVKRLAEASERAGRGQWSAPLPLSGPREARELTAAFNAMQERLARHVETRTRMLAAISHDFNTPITELRLLLELLPPSPERQDMLESVAELGAMVRETLAFVRDDAANEPLRRFCLDALADTLVRRYRRLGQPLRRSGWRGPAACLGRPLALKRALTNLIDNAIVHGGDAELALHRDDDNGWCLEIRDHGPGIPEACLEQVFEPFVRLDRNRIGGLGLGLAIARTCIRAHGGELELRNMSPGLCAVVRLPYAPA
ncbi:MAG: HAMP domain-containing sensor histidine kinase [Pseudomonas sp.]